MDNVFDLPIKDHWQFTVDIYRKPSGDFVARLDGMRREYVEAGESTREAMFRLVGLLRKAADGMEAEAALIGEQSEAQS